MDWPVGSCVQRGWAGRPGHDRRPEPGHRRRRLRGHPAAGGGSGGPPHRRDPSDRVRLPGPGDHRPRRAGQGPAHRPPGARDRRGDRRAGRSGRLGGRLHQSGGHRDPGPRRRGAPGGRAVQRGHPCPTAHRSLPRGRPRHCGARARGAQPSDLGPVRRRRRGRPDAGAARPVQPRARAGERGAGRAAPPARRPALLLPPLLLLPRPRTWPSSRPRVGGRGPRWWPSSRPSCSPSTATRSW